MDVLEQVMAVALVLLLLVGTLWWLRRRGFAGISFPQRTAGRRLELIERLSLAPQHTLHLVRVGELELLIAASPSGCVRIETLSNGEPAR